MPRITSPKLPVSPLSRPRGRPRSETARKAVLRAALRLVAAHGYRALTIEGIAAAAGVGKQTIYRWWPSKAAVVLTALAEYADADIPVPDSGDGCDNLARFLGATFAAMRAGYAPILRALMAEAQFDATFAVEFRERLIDRRRAAMRMLLARAQARGELAAAADLEVLLDFAFGAMWYRLLLEHAPLSSAAAKSIARAVFAAGSAESRAAAPRRRRK